jgi:hypothetical protein
MVAFQRRFCPLLNPVGSRGVCSSPGFEIVLITVLIPSLLLTVAVCGLLYLSVRLFKRRQIVFSAVTLIAALSPFILFVNSTVQSILADRAR